MDVIRPLIFAGPIDRNLTCSDQSSGSVDDWPTALSQFVKIMPTDYKRLLAEREAEERALAENARRDRDLAAAARERSRPAVAAGGR